MALESTGISTLFFSVDRFRSIYKVNKKGTWIVELASANTGDSSLSLSLSLSLSTHEWVLGPLTREREDSRRRGETVGEITTMGGIRHRFAVIFCSTILLVKGKTLHTGRVTILDGKKTTC